MEVQLPQKDTSCPAYDMRLDLAVHGEAHDPCNTSCRMWLLLGQHDRCRWRRADTLGEVWI